MKNKLLLFFLLTVTTPLVSQVTTGTASMYDPNYNNRSRVTSITGSIQNKDVTVRASGIANYIADSYVATFSLTSVGDTKYEVDDVISERFDGLKKDLVNLGIPSENIKTDLVSLVPAFEVQTETKLLSKSYNEEPIGLECQKTITIVLNKSEQLESIVSKALEHGIYNLVKVDFHISNLKEKKEDLKMKCIAELEKKISMTKKMGLKTDSMRNIMNENFDVIYPSSRHFSYQPYASYATAKGKNVKVAPKTSIKYYNQVEYSNYDIVENPIVTEPVIQITYEFSISYFYPQAETFKLVTPVGGERF